MSFEIIGFIMCYLNRNKQALIFPEAGHGFLTVIALLHAWFSTDVYLLYPQQ